MAIEVTRNLRTCNLRTCLTGERQLARCAYSGQYATPREALSAVRAVLAGQEYNALVSALCLCMQPQVSIEQQHAISRGKQCNLKQSQLRCSCRPE